MASVKIAWGVLGPGVAELTMRMYEHRHQQTIPFAPPSIAPAHCHAICVHKWIFFLHLNHLRSTPNVGSDQTMDAHVFHSRGPLSRVKPKAVGESWCGWDGWDGFACVRGVGGWVPQQAGPRRGASNGFDSPHPPHTDLPSLHPCCCLPPPGHSGGGSGEGAGVVG